MPPTVDLEKCTGCGDCYDVCPAEPNCFEIKDKKSHVVCPESCIECGSCESSCPEAAITLE
ncbi:MAG: indolepyruvate ferredoxin oxidoreductase subunit alpha [Promethearchaeota archaeon]